ncbi:SDR family oxidoreductase [Pokkaliibacter sp. CJK22405]|uniref:SDR family oxidoreductase n=1 Tax=Pokkaliibacter sp. CJK22405 TaxID=3384615 RepID=UPI0039854A05
MTLNDKRVLVLGGSSGIGFGIAKAVRAAGGKVTIASRSAERINQAVARLGGSAHAYVLDTHDNEAIEKFFAEHEPFDHIFVSAASTTAAPVISLPLDAAYESFESKFWGAYRVARAARVAEGGSITLVSGYLSIRPRAGAAIQGAINAALEGLTKGLALELSPIRVNCISPGLVETEMLDGKRDDSRQAMFDGAAERLPVKMVGKPEYIALQVLAMMQNPYMTGSVVYLEGGGALI